MSLTGIDEIELSSHSQIMKAMRPIEMVLVMDTTGSMATDDKIGGAKTAAQEPVEYGLWRISRIGSGKRILCVWRSCLLPPLSGSTQVPTT